MRFENKGIILNLHKYTDNSYIASVLSQKNGLIKGLIRNKKNQLISMGNSIFFKYARKNTNNLGNFNVDKIDNIATEIFFNSVKLMVLHSALVIVEQSIPENEPNEKIFQQICKLQKSLQTQNIENSIISYIKFELFFLQEMGFGLNLHSCPIHGTSEKFGYISPKIGRVISTKAGEKYKKRLFVLPKLFQNQPTNPEDLLLCLQITHFFLQQRIFNNDNLPPIRLLLQQKIREKMQKEE